MTSQVTPLPGYTIVSVSCTAERPMPKQKAPEATTFGQRLLALRNAMALTQQQLADEVGVSRRMIAYYEGQSEHPPTTLLPALARALQVSADALLGLAPTTQRNGRVRDTRMQRRLQQIATLPAEERRQILQLVDAFIERGQLKRRSFPDRARSSERTTASA
jgi:transcriptional regulator with XRE-family HTH domain